MAVSLRFASFLWQLEYPLIETVISGSEGAAGQPTGHGGNRAGIAQASDEKRVSPAGPRLGEAGPEEQHGREEVEERGV